MTQTATMHKPIEGFILSAGLGTRMGPLSNVLPKPAWPLSNKPLIRWCVEAMRRNGIGLIGCNIHHLPVKIREALADLEDVCIFDEPLLLGSAGGLTHVRHCAADPLAVWNGDAIADIPWEQFIHEHRRRDAELSWLLVSHDGGPWNPVYLNEAGQVLPQGQKGQGPFHFTGAALWSAKALSLLPEGISDTKADLLPLISHHAGIVVAPFPWLEVGTPDHLIQAAAALAPEHEGRIPGCYVHPTATPAGLLDHCILGPGAHPHPAMQDKDALWYEEEGRQVRLSLVR